MPGYIEVFTDPTGPSNSPCPPSVCVSISRMAQPYYGSSYLQLYDKVPVTGGHRLLIIDDQYFDTSRLLVQISFKYGATQWATQEYLTKGQTLPVTYYFTQAQPTPSPTPEPPWIPAPPGPTPPLACQPGASYCTSDGVLYVCGSDGVFRSAGTCTPSTPAPAPGPEPEPAPTPSPTPTPGGTVFGIPIMYLVYAMIGILVLVMIVPGWRKH